MYQMNLTKKKRVAVAVAALLVAVGATSAQAQDALKCRRSIAKNAAGFEAKKIKALQKCQDGILNGKGTSCPDSKATEKINKALAKLNDKIGGDCGGLTLADMNFAGLASECTGGYTPGLPCKADSDCSGICVTGPKDGDPCTTDAFCAPGTCSGALQCDPADKCPSVQNDATGNPFPGSQNCYAPVSDAASVATCVACIGEATVDQLIDTYYGSARAASDDSAVKKCQRAVGKAAAKHFAKVRKALQKCQDGVLKAGSGSCPDPKATDKISKSVTKVLDAITKDCDDTALNQGFIVSQLIAASGRPSPACLTHSGAAADLAAAIECLTSATAEANDALGIGSSPVSANPLCGNGKIDAGETCDDGNQLEDSGVGAADVCPSDCAIAPCVANGTQNATVNFSSAVDLTGMTVVVYYDESKVMIPGSNGDAAVQAAVLSSFFAMTPNDTDYALRNVLIDPSLIGVPAGEAFTVAFSTCQGAPAPVAADFGCVVVDATDASSAAVPGVSCSVTVP